jgi:hypothetical protein
MEPDIEVLTVAYPFEIIQSITSSAQSLQIKRVQEGFRVYLQALGFKVHASCKVSNVVAMFVSTQQRRCSVCYPFEIIRSATSSAQSLQIKQVREVLYIYIYIYIYICLPSTDLSMKSFSRSEHFGICLHCSGFFH